MTMEKQFLFVDAANPTWLVYVSVLVLAVFFRFSRLFSVRNLDVLLILLISVSLVITSKWKNVPPDSAEPASWMARLAQVDKPQSTPDSVQDAQPSDAGSVVEEPRFHPIYTWSSISLLGFSLLLMIRLIYDESLTRRPRLDQNLNQSGITFLCIPAFGLLMCSVFFTDPPDSTMSTIRHGRALLERRDVPTSTAVEGDLPPAPTETLFAAGAASVVQLSSPVVQHDRNESDEAMVNEILMALSLVVVAHTIVVLGLVYIGKTHFGSLQLGLSMSLLYLLLPSTGYHVHQLSHVLPGACLTWAIASYRKPAVAGVLLGLASGTLFFAVFLVPLWAVFYGRNGALRFGTSLAFVAAILVGCLILTSADTDSFMRKIVTTTNWTVFQLLDETASSGVPLSQLFLRIPLGAVFFVMLTAMTVLPRPRNLENLLANSTALVVAAQLWYPDDIGTYVLWYLPLFLLVIFRPRLDRFMPPELVARQSESITQPITATPTSSVAMSRLSL
ncbi:MAG: hypothetical protein JNL58_26815 [Planctomyces sp.]|nr:hypothetical protein [Planctomyces sp.]